MKNWIFIGLLFTGLSTFGQQTIKSKALKLKYVIPAGWKAEEAANENSWDIQQNTNCNCAYLQFTKEHSNGLLNIMVYPSDIGGLDSAKRQQVGLMKFTPVEKFDKIRSKHFSMEKRRSIFINQKTNRKAYDVLRYTIKSGKHFYIVYAWQQNPADISPDTEKKLFEVINGFEPL